MIRRVVGVWVVLVVVSPLARADLPEALQKELDKAKADHAEAYKAIEKKMLEAFEAEGDGVRKSAALKAEAKQEVLEAIGAERETFEKHGTLPFSARMRAATTNHLKAVRQADAALAKAFDKVIDHHTKAKDDAAAMAQVAEKKKALKPAVAGVWECKGENFTGTFTWTLYADGSAEPHKSTWKFDKDKLVILNKNPEAPPPGGWTETCVLAADGQTFAGRNNSGGKYKARRIDPPKE